MTPVKVFLKKCILSLALGVFSLWPNIVQGYEVPVHSQLTEKSYNSSILASGYLQELGIVDSKVSNKKVIDWFKDGSEFEDGDPVDSFSFRPLNHFYDPVTQSGLIVWGVPLGTDSINWGLEQRALGTLTQNYSIVFWCTLIPMSLRIGKYVIPAAVIPMTRKPFMTVNLPVQNQSTRAGLIRRIHPYLRRIGA